MPALISTARFTVSTLSNSMTGSDFDVRFLEDNVGRLTGRDVRLETDELLAGHILDVDALASARRDAQGSRPTRGRRRGMGSTSSCLCFCG